VKQLIRASGCIKNPETIQLLEGKNRREGKLLADGLELTGGGIVRFIEHIVLSEDGEVSRPIYSYEFRGDTVNFRYERDPKRHKPVVHEEFHLHINDLRSISGDELRFKTHETNFEEVFTFIANCFSI
jgi:hypothetical protein